MIYTEIRAALAASPRTVRELAEATKVNRVTLSKFKAGSVGLSVESLERLAGALGLEIVTRPIMKKSRK